MLAATAAGGAAGSEPSLLALGLEEPAVLELLEDAGPLDILVNGKHANAGADNLRKALAKIGAKKAEK